MALLTGIDLSFFRDDGFKKWGAVIIAEIGIIIWVAKELMPVAQGLEWLITILGAYVGINLGARALVGIQAAKESKLNATVEVKK
jgi:hypothetical protein